MARNERALQAFGHLHCFDYRRQAEDVIRRIDEVRPSLNTSARVYKLARRLARVPTPAEVSATRKPLARGKNTTTGGDTR